MNEEEKLFLNKVIKKYGYVHLFEEISNQTGDIQIREIMEDIIDFIKDEDPIKKGPNLKLVN